MAVSGGRRHWQWLTRARRESARPRRCPVRIDRIDLYRVAMPLITPWRTAYGEDAVIESVLVKMTGGGAVGWGEASPLAAPTYSPEWAAAVFQTMKAWLAPRLAGQDVGTGEA